MAPESDAVNLRQAVSNLTEIIRLQTESLRFLCHRVHALEMKMPGVPEVLSAAQAHVVYGISQTTLFQLSRPDRKPRVLTRYKRAGGGTGFLRSEIERYLYGIPQETEENRGRRRDENAGREDGVSRGRQCRETSPAEDQLSSRGSVRTTTCQAV